MFPHKSDRNIREMGKAVIDDGDGHFHLAAWWWRKKPHIEGREGVEHAESRMSAAKRDRLFEALETYLTDRQYEVWVLWRKGWAERRIGAVLGITHQTVSEAKEYIRKKALAVLSQTPARIAVLCEGIRPDSGIPNGDDPKVSLDDEINQALRQSRAEEPYGLMAETKARRDYDPDKFNTNAGVVVEGRRHRLKKFKPNLDLVSMKENRYEKVNVAATTA